MNEKEYQLKIQELQQHIELLQKTNLDLVSHNLLLSQQINAYYDVRRRIEMLKELVIRHKELMRHADLRDDAELIINYDLAFKSNGTTYTYDDKGNPVAVEEYKYNNRHSAVQLNTLKLSSSGTELTEWLPNHHYVYLIHIGAKRIDFTGIVVDWGDTQIWNDIDVDEIVLP